MMRFGVPSLLIVSHLPGPIDPVDSVGDGLESLRVAALRRKTADAGLANEQKKAPRTCGAFSASFLRRPQSIASYSGRVRNSGYSALSDILSKITAARS